VGIQASVRSQAIRSNRHFRRALLGAGIHPALKSLFTIVCFLVNVVESDTTGSAGGLMSSAASKAAN